MILSILMSMRECGYSLKRILTNFEMNFRKKRGF